MFDDKNGVNLHYASTGNTWTLTSFIGDLFDALYSWAAGKVTAGSTLLPEVTYWPFNPKFSFDMPPTLPLVTN